MSTLPKLVEQKIRKYLQRQITSFDEFEELAIHDQSKITIIKYGTIDKDLVVSYDQNQTDITERFFEMTLPLGTSTSPFQHQRGKYLYPDEPYLNITILQPTLNPEWDDYIEQVYLCKVYHNQVKSPSSEEESPMEENTDNGIKWKMILLGSIVIGICVGVGYRYSR